MLTFRFRLILFLLFKCVPRSCFNTVACQMHSDLQLIPAKKIPLARNDINSLHSLSHCGPEWLQRFEVLDRKRKLWMKRVPASFQSGPIALGTGPTSIDCARQSLIIQLLLRALIWVLMSLLFIGELPFRWADQRMRTQLNMATPCGPVTSPKGCDTTYGSALNRSHEPFYSSIYSFFNKILLMTALILWLDEWLIPLCCHMSQHCLDRAIPVRLLLLGG